MRRRCFRQRLGACLCVSIIFSGRSRQSGTISWLILFDISGVSAEELPYVGILQAVLGVVDTNNYEYGQLFNEINVHTGGIGTSLEMYTDVTKVHEKVFKATFEMKTKSLYHKMPVAFEMMREILTQTKFEDTKQIYKNNLLYYLTLDM